MSGVKMLHFLEDRQKFIQIHQYYTMALNTMVKYNITFNIGLLYHYIRDHLTYANTLYKNVWHMIL